jgi:hypothetical protein
LYSSRGIWRFEMMGTALLTLDKGSVLMSPQASRQPAEIVTQHGDGEIVKVQGGENSNSWTVYRQLDSDGEFFHDGSSRGLPAAVAGLADRQAFGFRADGEPTHPLVGGYGDAATVELEPANRGAVLVEDATQLPLTVYTTDEVYYRLYMTESENSPAGSSKLAVLERRKGPRGEWEELDADHLDISGLVQQLADDAGMVALQDPSGKDIREVINEYEFDFYPASDSADEEKQRSQMGVKDDTVFEPNFPKPRPICSQSKEA